MNRILTIIISSLIVIGAYSHAQQVQAKPSGHVIISSTIVNTIEPGETVTGTIHLRANTDLPLAVVSIAVDQGLILESAADATVLADVARGAVRNIPVSVKLIDRQAYITVTAETTDISGRVWYTNKMIKIGKDVVKQLKPVDNSLGEKLILMPAEVIIQ